MKNIKNLLKAISIELYDPNRIMDWNQDVLSIEDHIRLWNTCKKVGNG